MFLQTDASLTGAGAICGQEYFRMKFDEYVLAMAPHIMQLEMLTVCIAIKIWASKMAGKYVRIATDNQNTMHALNQGKSTNNFMLQCLREIAWYSAKCGFMVTAKYIRSCDNKLPDLLSRWYGDPEAKRTFKRITRRQKLKRIIPMAHHVNFRETW